MYTTLVSPSVLANHLNDTSWCVIDCRFDLAAPDKGEQQFQESRIPGARYAHLDRDLSGDKDGTNGRHPLPSPADMIARFSRLGVENGAQVVVYDGDSSMFAARLWWMLRFMGHEGVAVLDGGFARWTAEGRPVTSGRSKSMPTAFRGLARQAWRLGVDEVVAGLGDPGRCWWTGGRTIGTAASTRPSTRWPATFPAPQSPLPEQPVAGEHLQAGGRSCARSGTPS